LGNVLQPDEPLVGNQNICHGPLPKSTTGNARPRIYYAPGSQNIATEAEAPASNAHGTLLLQAIAQIKAKCQQQEITHLLPSPTDKQPEVLASTETLEDPAQACLSEHGPNRTSSTSLKLSHNPDQAPTLDCSQEYEINSHFVKVIDGPVLKLNKKTSPISARPYFRAQLPKAISIKTLYDTGADISCISSQMIHALPVDLHPVQQPGPSPSCQVANGQNHTMGVYIMNVQIGNHMVDHLFQFIQRLHEDTMMGIDFINKHKMVHNPSCRQYSGGSQPKWGARQIQIAKATSLLPGTNKAVCIDLVTDG
jgi:gag-polyprotein putative aspartyl protease